MKVHKSKTAAIAFAIAMSAALPTAAHAEGKDCAGDARIQSFAGMAYRMTGLTVFYDAMYRVAERQKYYRCRL